MNVNDTVKSTLENKTHICPIQNACMNPCLNDKAYIRFIFYQSFSQIYHTLTLAVFPYLYLIYMIYHTFSHLQ